MQTIIKRVSSVLISLSLAITLLAVSIHLPVFAESEAETGASTASEESGDSIDYSHYPPVTESQAVKMIAKSIKDHKKVLRFSIDGYSDNYRNGCAYAGQLLEKAYGNIPEYYKTEEYIYNGSYTASRFEEGCFEYDFEYKFSKKQCDAFEKKLKKVEKSLNLKGLSDKKKAFKIYRWVTKNVNYDKKTFNAYMRENDPYELSKSMQYSFTAYGALMNKRAVCQGIACLYYRMLKDAGVDACMISANALESSVCHTWVLVKIGKKWYNTDPTYDGIMHKKDTRYEYFLKTDKSYKKLKHYLPKKTKQFNKNHPMGKKNLKY